MSEVITTITSKGSVSSMVYCQCNIGTKIVLFAKQLNMYELERKGMKRIAYYVSLIYVLYWHETIVLLCVPKNYLEVLQLLSIYS